VTVYGAQREQRDLVRVVLFAVPELSNRAVASIVSSEAGLPLAHTTVSRIRDSLVAEGVVAWVEPDRGGDPANARDPQLVQSAHNAIAAERRRRARMPVARLIARRAARLRRERAGCGGTT